MSRLVLATAVACLAVSAEAANITWIGSGSNANWSTGGNWAGGVAPANGDTLVWTGSVGFGNAVSFNDISNLSLNSIQFNFSPAGVVLSGSAVTLTNGTPIQLGGATVGAGYGTVNLDMTLATSPTFPNSNGNGDIVFNGAISGAGSAFGISSNGAAGGIYAFNGANTFSSGTVVVGANQGTANVLINTLRNTGSAQSLGTGNVVQLAGNNSNSIGLLYYTGGETSTNKNFKLGGDVNLAGQNGGFFNNGSGAVTWSGVQVVTTSTSNRVFTLGGFNTDANTWSGAIGNSTSGTNSLTKAGRGTWVLSGANTFTGTTAVNSGKLVLDYATNATVLGGTNALTLQGGTLEFKARSSGSSAQTLGNVTASTDTGLSTVRVDQNGGAGMAVTLGTVATTSGKSALLFDLNGSAASSVTIGTAITPDTGTDGKILIRSSSGGYDFAVNGGSTANPLSARATSGTIGLTNGSSTTDYLFTNTGSVGAGNNATAVAARSLRIAPTQNNQSMTIMNTGTYTGGGGAGMIVNGGGLIYDGGANNFTIAATTGSNGVAVRAGNNPTGFILHHMGTGTLTIGERVYLGYAGGFPGNGVATPVGLFGAGSGLIDWRGGTNVINGAALMISGVVVRVTGTVDTPVLLDTTATGRGSMNVALSGGGVLEAVNGNITRTVGTAVGAIQWKGDGGFSAFGGNREVNLGGGTVTWGGSSFVPSDNALVLSSPHSDSLIDFQNSINLTGLQRVVRVHNGSAPVDARISGTLSSGLTGGLLKDGDGTLELTAANTYMGDTRISAGRLSIASAGSINSTNRITLDGSGAEFKYNSSTALTRPLRLTQGTLSGTGAINPADGVSVGTGAVLSPGNSPGIMPIGTGLALTPGGTYVWETNSGTGTKGVNWDLINVTAGGLDLSALSGTARFNLDLTTLTATGSSGPMENYTAGGSYTWRIFDADALTLPGSFSTPYAPGTDITNLFTLLTSNWKNPVPAQDAMSVRVAADGTGIDLVVVPEPATLVLVGIGVGIAGLTARCRRRRAKDHSPR